MTIHLIRHAHAGNRSEWDSDDTLRPLSEKGWRQARAIAAELDGTPVDLLLTSPYARCRQTLEPIAEQAGLAVVDHPELAEATGGAAALDALLAAAADGKHVMASSHGDVIPAIVATAIGRGAKLDGPVAVKKGARYEMEIIDGAVTRIVHHAVPDVASEAPA